MKMKQPIVMMAAAMAFSFTVQAQSLEEGIKLYKYERYESAKKALEPLAASNPTANYYLGLSELALGNTGAAKAIFSKNAENYANASGLIRVTFAEGRTAEGNQTAQGLAAKAKKKEWEQIKYAADALNYSEGGNKQLAVDYYKDAQAKKGDVDADFLIAIGDAYDQLPTGGGQAATSYEKASEKDAKNSLAFSRIGKLWYAAKNYDLALSNWKKASEIDNQNPLPYRDLARAYQASGKYDLALQNVEKYYELSDKTTEDKLNYMDLLFLSKNYDRAVQMAQDLLNAGVKNPRINGLLGFAQYELNDTANALNNVRVYFEKRDAAKILPADYIMYGNIWRANSKGDSADFYYNKAIAMDTSGDKTGTIRTIAEGFKTSKDYKQSAAWYGKTAAQPGAQALDYFWWGTMHYYSNNYADAAKAFEQMETKFPEQPSATYWRGRTAAAIDNEAKSGDAEPFYTKWLSTTSEKKKGDLMQAYQYLALYFYNKGDKDSARKYLDLIETTEPGNDFAKQLRDAMTAKPATKGK
jgi:tetratricopeptide (TPR) repeat protein